jgi:hypothetical protein
MCGRWDDQTLRHAGLSSVTSQAALSGPIAAVPQAAGASGTARRGLEVVPPAIPPVPRRTTDTTPGWGALSLPSRTAGGAACRDRGDA